MSWPLDEREFYFIVPSDGGYTLRDQFKFMIDVEELRRVANGMLLWADTHDQEYVEQHNDRLIYEHEHPSSRGYEYTPPVTKLSVYLFECGGRYKVGISKDVERRTSELDNRPFPLKILACSKPITHARRVEQSLHEMLEEQAICGEWFELTDDQVEYVTEYLNELRDQEE